MCVIVCLFVPLVCLFVLFVLFVLLVLLVLLFVCFFLLFLLFLCFFVCVYVHALCCSRGLCTPPCSSLIVIQTMPAMVAIKFIRLVVPIRRCIMPTTGQNVSMLCPEERVDLLYEVGKVVVNS